MTRIQKLFRRRPRERALFIEALLRLAWAKFLVRVIPFRRLAPNLGRPQAETTSTISPEERALAVEISWAVQAAARHVPLRFVCLPQALAAKRMLQNRGLPSTLYLGVAPGLETPDTVSAHAWLRAGDKIVTGEHEIGQYAVVATFAAK